MVMSRFDMSLPSQFQYRDNEIVAMHLFELWATALCGADTVEHTLRAAFDIYSDS